MSGNTSQVEVEAEDGEEREHSNQEPQEDLEKNRHDPEHGLVVMTLVL